MQRNQQYAPYRPELTAEQRERIDRAKNPTEEYGKIAIEEARKQLAVAENTAAGENALPEGEDIGLRFPGVDPRGQYSSIDMKIKERTQRLDAVLNLREESVRALVNEVLSSPAVAELWKNLKQVAKRHRLFTRAEKLCWDEAAADSLHVQVRKLEVDPAVAEMDVVLQGLEYLLGIREGEAPEEIERFCRDRLGLAFTPEQRGTARRIVQPEEAGVFFPDFDNILLQALFSMPENWGLSLEELEALRDEE